MGMFGAYFEPPAEVTWCFAGAGPGGCGEPLGAGPVPPTLCCLNPAYAVGPAPGGPCLPCRPASWAPWTPWGPCSVTCGEGTQRRHQDCQGRGGCGGPRRRWELRGCEGPCCPEGGGWSPWSPWGGCSASCGGGEERRHRACASPAPRCGGRCPPGASSESRACAEGPCPRAGSWSPWSPWAPCAASCRGGAGPPPTQSRSRRCDSPAPSREPPGPPCEGAATEGRPCPGLPPCPEDGAWGPWSPVSPCAVTCGLGAVTLRRACDAPPPRHGGRGCPGNATRAELCGPFGPCPADGHWGPWSPWSPCARPLGGPIACRDLVGRQRRTRSCLGREPGGAPCPPGPPSTIELRACYSLERCLLPGNWSEWSPWGLCTPPCGASPTRSRSRECRPELPPYA
ncbi:properdin [Eudromia elegans]